ncbi:DUF1615 domain-containing protein [Piscinibacter sakaiensis]|uniref:DUF1615 domain-containing protein n=1 Tax=Piscinibacter sakaiensis TaxID=1547922 RepID=UPI003AB02E0A
MTAHRTLFVTCAVLLALLGGCAVVDQPVQRRQQSPSEVRAQIVALIPSNTRDREGWATDIQAAFAVLRIEPSQSNICSVLAIVEQESTYRVDPSVPGLGKIAWAEIERKAERAGIPFFLVRTALQIKSSEGRSYAERIDAARTEKQLSELFDEFIGMVPLGRRLFAGYNPVRTGGPMQVAIAFAERHASQKPYPYPVDGSIRDEVFTRRGGMYFGIAHLLDYPARYEQPIYRYADFNAGHYASRNAAFQRAVSLASGIPLELDGDLVRENGDPDKPGQTELAVRTLAEQIGLDNREIRRMLELGDKPEFDESRLHQRVFELAEQYEGRPLPRALIPRIKLVSPKITRNLTTEWFATRVAARHKRCLARDG